MFTNDTSSFAKLYDLPVGNENMERVVVDKEGNLFKQPVKNYNIIENKYDVLNTDFLVSQKNATLYTDGLVMTDSGFVQSNERGLYISFAPIREAVNYGTTWKSNIQIHNSIFGSTRAKNTISGNNNILFHTSYGNSRGSITGNTNVLINTAPADASTVSGSKNISINGAIGLTSGSNNIGIGENSLLGITTGSRNIHLIMNNGNGNAGANISNSMIFGEFATESDNQWQTNDVSFSSGGLFAATNIWLGGRSVGERDLSFNVASVTNVSNYKGNDFDFNLSRGRGTGRSGNLRFYSYNSTTSGTTLHSVKNLELTIANDSVTVDARLRVNAATFINKDSLPITTGKLWHIVVDTPTNQLMRQQVTAAPATRMDTTFAATQIAYIDRFNISDASRTGFIGNISTFSGTGSGLAFQTFTHSEDVLNWLALSSGTQSVAGNSRSSIKNLNTFIAAGTTPTIIEWRVNLSSLGSASDAVICKVGLFFQAVNTDETNGAFFLFDTTGTSTGSAAVGRWQTVTALSSVRTYTTTSVPVTTNWTKLKIRITSTRYEFFINDVLVSVHTTNLPTPEAPNLFIRKQTGSTAVRLWPDYFAIYKTHATVK